ncbi:MAG: Ig-like domain-containing protein, partial [bacterium]|nr:Ig-like domain-containing protein [bacterium]
MDQPESFSPEPSRSPFGGTLKSKTSPLKNWFHDHPNKKIVAGLGVFLILALAFAVVQGIFGGASFFVPKTNYVPVYTLVNEKISEHGAVIVNLPDGVSKKGAELKVSFEPSIPGEWVTSPLPSAIVYKPASALALGKHYQVALTTDVGVIKKDFLVDEDPRVVSVFPDSAAEAELASAITIVFNRPMVPLTTLSELENKNIPVSISPATPGKFKWISTRTLQFIPARTLWGSAHYRVEISSDFVSMDGLAIPKKTYEFTTKQLRLNRATSGEIIYNQPIQFYFNQPVDLQKTSGEITLTNNATNATLEFAASYGTSPVWDENSKKYVQVEDRSIISIVPKNSLRGHANVWDFSTPYTASIKIAYPVGGDIALTNSSSPLPITPKGFPEPPNVPGTGGNAAAVATVTTSPVLESVTVESEKTPLASVQ